MQRGLVLPSIPRVKRPSELLERSVSVGDDSMLGVAVRRVQKDVIEAFVNGVLKRRVLRVALKASRVPEIACMEDSTA